MNIEELSVFIKKETARLATKYPHQDPEKRLYADTVKLSEEVGELCNAVLATGKIQRSEKLEQTTHLEQEIADVLIVTMIIAEQLGIDPSVALKEKIEKIEKRYKQDNSEVANV